MIENPGIISIGSSVPSSKLTNRDLENTVDTSDEWITTRTGIKERRILKEDEDPAIIGVEACRKAIDSANLSMEDIDFIVTASNIQLMPIPGSSPFILEGLGIEKDIPFFDLIAGCTGFVYGLEVARNILKSNYYTYGLVLGLEALSRFINWEERETCVLFGDGAGAAILGPVGEERGIMAAFLSGDSSKWPMLRVESGGTREPATKSTLNKGGHYLKMEGQGVYKDAVNMMKSSSLKALKRANVNKNEVDWFVPHQANLRIIKSFAKKLNVPMSKVLVNLDKYGNTSTASIPLVLDEAYQAGKLKSGDLIVLTAFGSGVTYGAVVLRW